MKKSEQPPTGPTKSSIEFLFKQLYGEVRIDWNAPEGTEEEKLSEKIKDMEKEHEAKLNASISYKGAIEERNHLRDERKARNEKVRKQINKLQGHYRLKGATPEVIRKLQALVDEFCGKLEE